MTPSYQIKINQLKLCSGEPYLITQYKPYTYLHIHRTPTRVYVHSIVQIHKTPRVVRLATCYKQYKTRQEQSYKVMNYGWNILEVSTIALMYMTSSFT